MVCRSCSLGPSKVKPNKTKSEPVNQSKPMKGLVNTSKRKVSVPTRSPARTFNTVGDN
jgi:hypothetical protein